MLNVLRQRNFALLWTAGLISIAGDYALRIAIPLYVFRLTGSTLATATAFAASVLPGILIGSVAGVFVDRWDRKRTMIWADLIRVVIMLPLLFTSSLGGVWLVYIVAAIESTIGLFFTPAERALLPTLVGKDELVTANALNASNSELGRLAGPAIGASLFAAAGIGGVAVVDGATFLASALLIRFITAQARPPAQPGAESGEAVWLGLVREWKEELLIVRQSRELVTVFIAMALSSLQEGAFVTLALAPFVIDVLGGTERQVGWFMSAQAIGGITAGIIVGRLGHRFQKRLLFGAGLIGLGLSDLSMFNSYVLVEKGVQAVVLASAFMVLAGFPAVAGGVGRVALLQDVTGDSHRGRVFGALATVQGVFMLLGLALAGFFGDRVGIVPVMSAGCVLGMIGGVVALARLRREPEQRPPQAGVHIGSPTG